MRVFVRFLDDLWTIVVNACIHMCMCLVQCVSVVVMNDTLDYECKSMHVIDCYDSLIIYAEYARFSPYFVFRALSFGLVCLDAFWRVFRLPIISHNR